MEITKNLSKPRSVALLIALPVLLIGSSACRKTAAVDPTAVDAGDDKAAANSIAEGDRLYAERGDMTKARSAVTLYRQARTADYGNFEAAWKLARASFYVGSHNTGDVADDAFREGIEAGKAAIKLKDDRPEGHFWLGANYGGSAERSTLTGLSSVEDIRTEMEKVIQLDEKFQAGSAYMALGQLYMQAPRVLGGDTAKAIDYFQKGVRVGPDNALLKLHLAEAYHQAGRDQEARKQIEMLMAMTPSPDYLPEYQEAREKGQKLLEKLK